MRNTFLLLSLFVFIFVSCQDDGQVFEKSADVRAEEAIAALKEKLIAPPNGWLIKYRPEQESGSFNVLLKFDENNNVNIKTDFGVNDGEFYDQTITYRIDNSLGLELVLETYSFFSYLFEQDGATFGAEYEFNYANETNGALVFRSKTDPSSPTTLVFQPALESDEKLLGIQLATNLNKLADNLSSLTSVFKLSYANKDLAFYLSFDDFRRTINFNYAAPKSGTEGGQVLNFSTGYIIQGDSILFDTPLTGNFMGNEVSVSSIKFNELRDTTLMACSKVFNVNQYSGSIASSPVTLESTFFDPNGANFTEASDFFYSYVSNIFDNGISSGQQIEQDVSGALAMLLYYDDNPTDPFLALGFYIINEDGSVTRALREFTPTLVGNQIQFDFASNYTLLGDTTATVNEEKMNIYVNTLAEGGSTYIFKYSENIYEFYNACNGFSYVFFNN